ncbi:MAG: ABC transporter substrate-binding protein [Acidimicrobiales bacterium]
MMVRRVVAAAVVLTTLAVACTGTSRRSTKAASAAAGLCPAMSASLSKPVTITVWASSGDPLLHPPGMELVAEFNAAHPAVHVVVDGGPGGASNDPYSGAESRFFSAVQNHQPLPDLVDVAGPAARAAIDTGALVPAQDCIDTNRADLSEFVPVSLAASRIGTTQWGMPFTLLDQFIGYNAEAFQQAGLDPNHPPTDLATLIIDARALQSHGYPNPIADLPVERIFRLSGVRFTDHDDGQSGAPARAAIDTPEAHAVLALLKQLVDDHLLAQHLPDNGGNGPNPGLVALGTGQVAIAGMGSSDVGVVLPAIAEGQAPGLTLRVGPIPSLHGPGGIASDDGSMYLTTGSTPARRAAAWQFITWLDQPNQQAHLAALTRRPPVRIDAADNPELVTLWGQNPLMRQVWDLVSGSPYTTEDLTGPSPAIAGYVADRTLGDLNKDVGLDDILNRRTQDINAILDDYSHDPAAWDRCYGEAVPCG